MALFAMASLYTRRIEVNTHSGGPPSSTPPPPPPLSRPAGKQARQAGRQASRLNYSCLQLAGRLKCHGQTSTNHVANMHTPANTGHRNDLQLITNNHWVQVWLRLDSPNFCFCRMVKTKVGNNIFELVPKIGTLPKSRKRDLPIFLMQNSSRTPLPLQIEHLFYFNAASNLIGYLYN